MKEIGKLLAIPDKFRETALAFPDQVNQVLALMSDPNAVKRMLDQADALELYTRRIKADTEITNSITYGKLKIVARLGELLPAIPPNESGKMKGKKKGTTSAGGTFIDPKTIARYRRIAKQKDKIDGYYKTASANEEPDEITLAGFVRFATGTEKAGTAAHVSANSGVPEWYTPQIYLDAARKVLGTVDLDPASSVIAQKAVGAKKYFTLDDDGLRKEWKGTVWLNPPYTSDLISQFVLKLCTHYKSRDVSAAILLTNNATETKWFQVAGKRCSAICFPSSRIRFLDENGSPGAPLQGQALLYFGELTKLFLTTFGSFGFCMISHG